MQAKVLNRIFAAILFGAINLMQVTPLQADGDCPHGYCAVPPVPNTCFPLGQCHDVFGGGYMATFECVCSHPDDCYAIELPFGTGCS